MPARIHLKFSCGVRFFYLTRYMRKIELFLLVEVIGIEVLEA